MWGGSVWEALLVVSQKWSFPTALESSIWLIKTPGFYKGIESPSVHSQNPEPAFPTEHQKVLKNTTLVGLSCFHLLKTPGKNENIFFQ